MAKEFAFRQTSEQRLAPSLFLKTNEEIPASMTRCISASWWCAPSRRRASVRRRYNRRLLPTSPSSAAGFSGLFQGWLEATGPVRHLRHWTRCSL